MKMDREDWIKLLDRGVWYTTREVKELFDKKECTEIPLYSVRKMIERDTKKGILLTRRLNNRITTCIKHYKERNSASDAYCLGQNNFLLMGIPHWILEEQEIDMLFSFLAGVMDESNQSLKDEYGHILIRIDNVELYQSLQMAFGSRAIQPSYNPRDLVFVIHRSQDRQRIKRECRRYMINRDRVNELCNLKTLKIEEYIDSDKDV